MDGTFSTAPQSPILEAPSAAMSLTVGQRIKHIIMSVLFTAYAANTAYDVARMPAIREIRQFTTEHETEPMTQDEFEKLDRQIRWTNDGQGIEKLFLHYGFQATAPVFWGGEGLRASSWCTKQVYNTGWQAKYYLAQYQGPPRNAIYIVYPKVYDIRSGPTPADERKDEFTGIYLLGGGAEWKFPLGTSRNTVFGPIPIPEGSIEDIE